MKKEILLVDGMALLFRGFYATAYRGNFMETSEGTPTNGIYQFLRYFINAIENFQPTHVIFCWDMGSQTFRTELYEEYKANRSAPPAELVPQFELIKEVTEAFDLPNVGVENYEADDCMGTLARTYSEENNVLILTGDHDILQLVDHNVRVAIMKKGIGNYDIFNKDNFYEKKGIYPNQLIDFKAFTGDSADNYPGVRGIGEKTALKLLNEHKTIEKILENIELLPKGVQTKINNNIDMLHLSRSLAQINCDIPISCNLEDAKWQYNEEKVAFKFAELEFKNMDQLLANASNEKIG